MLPRPTIIDAAAKIRSGKLRATELVEQCLARIERFEHRVRAWVVVDRAGALEAAARLDEELAAGKLRGPLHGIPVGVKDIIDVAGLPTRAGSPLTSSEPALRNAPVVARLKTAGAIVLGKTVTTEFACYDPPPTRNPWNLERTPGGSSSGSAAAVALGMCLGAIGTQTGGSIIRPASYCGVAGFKPSFGRVSRDGVVPVSESLDHVGPIASCVADLATMFNAIADWPARSAADNEPFSNKRPPRVGVMDVYFGGIGDAEIGELCRLASVKIHRRLEAKEVHGVELGFDIIMEDSTRWHRIVMAVEAARVHREMFATHRAQFGPGMVAIIGEGLGRPADEYREALARQRVFRERAAALLKDFDVLLMPSTPTVAPDPSTTGDPKFNSPWSFSGAPTITIPIGLASDGLPVGLQLIGAVGSDERLLAAAAWCEETLAWSGTPTLLLSE